MSLSNECQQTTLQEELTTQTFDSTHLMVDRLQFPNCLSVLYVSLYDKNDVQCKWFMWAVFALCAQCSYMPNLMFTQPLQKECALTGVCNIWSVCAINILLTNALNQTYTSFVWLVFTSSTDCSAFLLLVLLTVCVWPILELFSVLSESF